MKYGIWDLIRDQWTPQPAVLKADLTGKTILVTGANTGLGFEAAKHFASMNPGRLILACRNRAKGQVALENIQASTLFGRVELWIVDLADFDSVRQFVDEFEQNGGRLDIFVANAGIGAAAYEATKDGWESSIQVNHLSTSLLMLLLLPLMMQTAKEHGTTPRIVVVSTLMHYWAELDKCVLQSWQVIKTLGSAQYCTPETMQFRYPITKLVNLFFIRALNFCLSSSIIVNAVNPGYCYSELRRDFTGLRASVDHLMEFMLAFRTEVGSRQLVWAALADENEYELRGEYISGSCVKEVSDFVLSLEGRKAQEVIWEDTLDILNKVDPRVGEIVLECLSSKA